MKQTCRLTFKLKNAVTVHSSCEAPMQSRSGVQGCLGVAFVVEGMLFAFHLEGSELNWKAHLLLVLTIFAAVGAILGEIAAPGNVLLGLARAQLVMLQGVWFMQIAKLLFEGLAPTACSSL